MSGGNGKTLLDFGGGAWTISLWKDMESMQQFYLSGTHRKMMPMLDYYADEGANRTIEYGLYKLPNWKQIIHQKLEIFISILL